MTMTKIPRTSETMRNATTVTGVVAAAAGRR